MWLNAPCGPEQVVGSLMRTLTIALEAAAGLPLLLQLRRNVANVSRMTARVQRIAVRRMAEPPPVNRGTGDAKKGHTWESPLGLCISILRAVVRESVVIH